MSSAEADPLIAAICRLGFNELEAQTYTQLLRQPESTGYAVAKAIRRPHPNVYQALSALERKGAVVFESESSRVYTAIPPADLLRQLRRSFETECASAERAFASLEMPEPQEERLYRLTTVDQAMQRAIGMIENARESVLIYASPNVAPVLRPWLEAAVERDLPVAGIMLREADLIEGSKLIVSRIANRIAATWPRLPLILITDARELLLAQVDPERGVVDVGLWTQSAFLASILHNAIVSDIVLHGLPAIERVQSPNTHLLGFIPEAVRRLLLPREE